MASVSAKCDIVTAKGFTVARKGDMGQAPPGACPHDSENLGKILVFFKDNRHGYWCEPRVLRVHLLDPGRAISDYIPTKETCCNNLHNPSLPSSNRVYEYHFGRNLQMCRKARLVSQGLLGKLMGQYGAEVAQSTICYREKAPQSPGGKFINAAASALRVPAFIFFVPLDDCKMFVDARKFLSCMSSAMCENTN